MWDFVGKHEILAHLYLKEKKIDITSERATLLCNNIKNIQIWSLIRPHL